MNRIFKFKLADNKIGYEYDGTNPGHPHGSCFVSPDKKFNYVNIPKNASTALKRLFSNWEFSDFNKFVDIDQPKHLVVLRDPIDRWISGMTHYLWLLNKGRSEEEIRNLLNSQSFQNLIFDFVIFDNHTLPQTCFLSGLDLDKITFFYFDEGVVPKIRDYVGDTNLILPKKLNTSSQSNIKLAISTTLKSVINDSPSMQYRLNQYYFVDHQLLDKVKFYN
jgi:hypothetical protein